MTRNAFITPENWMLDIFSSNAARQGAVIRRKSRDIERYVGRDRFLDEVERRGFRAFENAGQVVVFCNREPLHRIV